jgi:DNA-binding transcriptional MocR family regulator
LLRGTPLPPTRRLAEELGVSRGVVIEAHGTLDAATLERGIELLAEVVGSEERSSEPGSLLKASRASGSVAGTWRRPATSPRS